MYTLLEVTGIIGIIVAGFLLVAIPLAGGMYYSDLGSRQKYTMLYSAEEVNEARMRQALIRKWMAPALALVFCLLFGFITLAFVSSKNLSEAECQKNEGEWAEWDSGLQWECYNPNNIDQSNNQRIILENSNADD